MADKFKALQLLRSLGDFDHPTGPAASLQTATLMEEMRQHAREHPNATYRLHEDGPEQTISEILAELDADAAAVKALRAALERDKSNSV